MSKIINTLVQTAKELDLDPVTVREIDALMLPEVKPMAPQQIKKMRLREKISQGLIAKILNVTPSTYQKWERGEIVPKGANLKLLRLVDHHGIEYILD